MICDRAALVEAGGVTKAVLDWLESAEGCAKYAAGCCKAVVRTLRRREKGRGDGAAITDSVD